LDILNITEVQMCQYNVDGIPMSDSGLHLVKP